MLNKKRQAKVDHIHGRSVKEKPVEKPVVKPVERPTMKPASTWPRRTPPKTFKPEEVKALVGDDDAD